MKAVKRSLRKEETGKTSSRTRMEQRYGVSEGSLVFIGVGGIIGAGFFLGCGLPIQTAGPSVLLAFVIAALVTGQVIGALTSIASNHPVRGSFQAYPAMYLGKFVGFLQGWTYYLTSILTISSEAVAMGVFVKEWLPRFPVGLMASVFAAIIVVINAVGVQNFTRVESIMSAVKIAALAGFIVYAAVIVLTKWLGSSVGSLLAPAGSYAGGFWPTGFAGMMKSMLVVIFTFAGIGVFATGMGEIRDPKQIDNAGMWTVGLLAVLYIASIMLLLFFIPWNQVTTSSSPFVDALRRSGIPALAQVFNAAILVAAFSVMAGSLYSANEILCSLGEEGDAPRFVTRRSERGTPYLALVVSAACIGLSLALSLLLPTNLYNFLISASSFLTLLNWFVILCTFLVWRHKSGDRKAFTSKLAFGQPVSTVITMLLLVVLAGYALLQRDQRIAFYVFVVLCTAIASSYLFVRRRARVES
ncbi:MAG: amino acid permease [Alicyclobacillus shizuokensis]|nr:amino acid permease [Alicyclobacillus shizuokensis]